MINYPSSFGFLCLYLFAKRKKSVLLSQPHLKHHRVNPSIAFTILFLWDLISLYNKIIFYQDSIVLTQGYIYGQALLVFQFQKLFV